MNRIFLVIVVAGLTLVSRLQAGMSVTLIDNTSQYSYGNGGEFRAVPNGDLLAATHNLTGYSSKTSGTITGPLAGDWGYNSSMVGSTYFQTFCVEYNEEFYPGTSYSVSISDRAMYGGQPPNGDPISIGTAWLYSQFAKGTLTGYNYTYGSGTRSPQAGLLQQAIWWLEGENGGVRTAYINTAEDALYGAHGAIQDAEIFMDANGAYGVAVLNLGAPGAVQDQLVVVPEPATLMAGALLLLPLGSSTIRRLRMGIRE